MKCAKNLACVLFTRLLCLCDIRLKDIYIWTVENLEKDMMEAISEIKTEVDILKAVIR